ncbi:MAG TPA: sigma-54 dependent transcriptional regulator [Bryobacteraceae bacterium]|nr:sigma-54 dependent transcriptional regulator [Bryobacteraceae bacterium]
MKTVLLIEENPGGAPAAMGLTAADPLQFLLADTISGTVETLEGHSVDAVLVHLPVAGVRAEELLAAILETGCKAPVILYEPDGAVSKSIELTRQGAFQYIAHAVKPSELRELLLEAIKPRSGNPASAATAPGGWRATLVGSSNSMQEVIEIIELVGNRRSTVLITGETGTGKEVAARALHLASNRSGSRMVAVNCAALPDHLLEAELFGHTRGAFTGAVNARVGLFEQAQRSTIFLDEIGEMPMPLQAKLLRVLQEREIQRIGSSEPIPIDVRVIAASNTNLLEAVANRRFREDLYYRLNVVALRMPSLRERTSDIPQLAEHFLEKIAEHEPAWRKKLSPQALETLMRYSWPGNVRQLEHALESAVALSGSRSILYPGDLDLPAEVQTVAIGPLSNLDVPETGLNFEELIAGIERRLLERALAKSGGNKARAASMLQMKRTTLISKFKSLEVCA